jgi:predicted nucleotidyltransferase
MSKENTKFPSHFRDFIIELNKHKVEYVLIGGYALGAYGHIRATNDLDIYINANDENALKMVTACIDYGVPAESVKKEMFLVQKMIGIGEPPLRIEILKKLDFVDFHYAFQRAIKVEVDGISINVVALDDLILLKKAAVKGRNKSRDVEDLSFLEKLKAKLKFKKR